jgi:hypothetical protein
MNQKKKFKEGTVAYFEVLQRKTSGGTKENDKSCSQRLYNCNANIYFNKQCLKQLTPTYAKIKVPNTSPAQKYTQYKILSI